MINTICKDEPEGVGVRILWLWRLDVVIRWQVGQKKRTGMIVLPSPGGE